MLKNSLVLLLFVLAAIGPGYAQTGPDTPPDGPVDAATKAGVVERLSKELNENYVFPEMGKKMSDDLKSKLAGREYDPITSSREFAERLTRDLQALSKDKHFRVRFFKNKLPDIDRGAPSAEEIENELRFMRRVNFGFEKVERLSGNVGYIDLRGFMDEESGAETVASAMNFLANTDALIFDLRQNGGGRPQMVALICSYLFSEQKVHLNDLYFRPANETTEFWTDPKTLGKKYGETRPVYILTSNYTFSGAEEFAYNLKNLKRATIIGEVTGGGAHPGGRVKLSDHFGVFIPSGRAINPITKTNWEGTGVQPDIPVAKEQALKTAHLVAIKTAMEKASDPEQKSSMKDLVDRLQKELDAMKQGAK
jgi:hypothetical protein